MEEMIAMSLRRGEPQRLSHSNGLAPAVRRRLYFVWRKMVARCTDPADPAFSRYGKRGIGVDARWLVFASFLDDMATTYRDGLTLERIENRSGYTPTNCKWADRFEQQANTRKTILITHDGETHCAREWGRRTGVDYRTILRRIRAGWPVGRALGKEAA